MTTFLKSRLTKAVAVLLVLCLTAAHLPAPVHALTPDKTPSEELKQIQYKYYFRGKYPEAVDALNTFLERKDLTRGIETAAREFLAASYILSGRPDKGKDQYLQMLNDDESYTGPDPSTFKAEVVEAFTSTRDTFMAVKLRTAPDTGGGDVASSTPVESESKPIYKKWWFYVGLAAALVVVGAAAAPKEEEGEPVPPAPTGTVTVGVRVQ
jgi:hypothetical protein